MKDIDESRILMQRAGKIICWVSLGLIALLFLKPMILHFLHLQYYSPWQQSAAEMKRYLQIAALLPFTLFATLQNKRFSGRLLIVAITLGLAGVMVYVATRNIDGDLDYPTHTVKELFQNSSDSTEKIILQTDNDVPAGRKVSSVVLKVKPFSRELQLAHPADTSHLEPGKWKRIN